MAISNGKEVIKCDLCGEDDAPRFLVRYDRFSQKSFQFVSCSNCGLIYLNPRPTQSEIKQFYPADYECFATNFNNITSAQKRDIYRSHEYQLNFINKYAAENQWLLDVGCGTGSFMDSAQKSGWHVLGIEPIEQAAQIAKEIFHLDVHVGSLETVQLPEQFFDVITLWDVLEHLPSPKSALHQILNLLKPNGTLIFSIPNLSSFDRYLFGSNWIGWDAPRHLYLFNKQNNARLLNSSGFNIIGKECITGGRGTFLLSLDQMIGKNNRPAGHQSFFVILSAILWPYRKFAYLLNRGPIITYAAIKK